MAVTRNTGKNGVKVLNEDITGQVHKDRNLLTRDSPLAANELLEMVSKIK